MTTLEELYADLAMGELSQHQYGNRGVIPDANKPTIIHYLNAALTAIYSEFPLRQREVLIQQYDNITEYHLNSKYAVSNTASAEPTKYILDSASDPFTDDIIRIESVYDEAGKSVALNDEYDPNSVFTTEWNTIQIPFPVSTNTTAVMYRAKHLKFTKDMPETTEIRLPPVLLPALHAYIASKCYTSLGNAASASLAVHYLTQYANVITLVKRENLLQSSDADSNAKLTAKGFR